MHIKWKNCSRAWKGQHFNPKEGKLATISCEAVCDRGLYCWHWYAGRCGTSNDISVKNVQRQFRCLKGHLKNFREERLKWSDQEIIFVSSVSVSLHNILVQMNDSGELDGEIADDGDLFAS